MADPSAPRDDRCGPSDSCHHFVSFTGRCPVCGRRRVRAGERDGALADRVRRGDVDDVVRERARALGMVPWCGPVTQKLARVRELVLDVRESLRSDDAVSRGRLDAALQHLEILIEPAGGEVASR